MSARGRVLGLPELLENILLNLPAKDLLSTQRVSNIFQAAITTSIHLQRRLYFRLSPTSPPPKDPNLLLLHPPEDPDYGLQIPGTTLATFCPTYPELRLFDINVPRVREFLTSGASFLDMYLQRSNEDIKITVFHDEEVMEDCLNTAITVRCMTFRNLLSIAVALADTNEAASMLARQRAEEEGVEVVAGSEAAWKNLLGPEFVEMVVEEPRVEDG